MWEKVRQHKYLDCKQTDIIEFEYSNPTQTQTKANYLSLNQTDLTCLSPPKTMNSLDVQDWELLPNDGFLDDGGSKNQSITIPNPNTTTSLMNYFFSPPKQVDTRVDPKIPNQLALEPSSPKLQEQREAARSPTPPEDEEEDFVPQVFFKKMKDGRAEFHFEKGNSKADLEGSRDRFNIWKLSLFGVAAAGVYIIISWGNSNKHQQNQKHHRRN